MTESIHRARPAASWRPDPVIGGRPEGAVVPQGQLRVYLGAAPGVGKTYKMLEEGHRRRERGTDVVVGYVETHGRRHTEAEIGDLEVMPRVEINHRGATFTEMDVEAVLARAPDVVLVDELAHTNVPGSRHAKRWQDVEELLAAGMTVITTLNVQHLESINDVVRQITGVPQRETVPDQIVRRAEQIELIDMAPEALRRRMAHGNVYRPEKVDAALGNYFRVGNLTALRELALLWVADKVDDELDRYRAEHRISATWETRDRVVVALTGGPEGETLIRRAARIAGRARGADLLAVHVTRNDGLVGGSSADLARQRTLVESLGGTYHQVVAGDVARGLLDFARGVNATELVLGVSRRGRLSQLLTPGVGTATAKGSGPMDVHLVTHEEVGRGRGRTLPSSALSPARQAVALGLAVAGLVVLTLVLTHARAQLTLPSDMLLYLAIVIGVALVGGLVPALVAAVLGSLLLNYYFAPPLHRFTIDNHENVLALVVFLAVAVAVSATVDRAARRTREAAAARAEAETLSTLAGSVMRGARPLPALLDHLRETLGFTGVTLLERRPDAPPSPDLQHDPDAWRVVAGVGDQPCLTPGQGDAEVLVEDRVCLVLRGRPPAAADRRIVQAFAAQAVVALRQEQLSAEAAAAGPLAEVDRMRTALLSAVSHDLRTPLASAKAAVGGLRAEGVVFTAHDREELLATVEESLDKLHRLVDNLLDMSRLQAGALAMTPQEMSISETIAMALDDLGADGRDIVVHLPEEFLEVVADPALVERILVNVGRNALRYSPAGEPPMIAVSAHGGFVETRVVDRGPGIPAADRDRVFLPFQRLGDRDNATGVGLGLALSRGLAEAMGGTLTPDTTPGGGLTMILRLPQARTRPADQARPEATEHRSEGGHP
jgi:two-component system, OmpR family, sensor histidine kinase KdpD